MLQFKKEFEDWSKENGKLFFLKDKHPWLFENALNMINNGGKRIRPYLYYYFLKEKKDYQEIAFLIETLHTSTLIIDDIQDHTELRRGKQCLHLEIPMPLALNVGLTMLFTGSEKLSPEMQKIINKSLFKLCLGQGDELSLDEKSLNSLNREKILSIYDNKTSELFILCYELARITNKEEKDPQITEDLISFGRYFQILDDIVDLNSGEDLIERKITIPFILLKESLKDDKILKKYLENKLDWKEIQKLMIKNKIPEKTKEFAESFASEIKSPAVLEIFKKLK